MQSTVNDPAFGKQRIPAGWRVFSIFVRCHFSGYHFAGYQKEAIFLKRLSERGILQAPVADGSWFNFYIQECIFISFSKSGCRLAGKIM